MAETWEHLENHADTQEQEGTCGREAGERARTSILARRGIQDGVGRNYIIAEGRDCGRHLGGGTGTGMRLEVHVSVVFVSVFTVDIMFLPLLVRPEVRVTSRQSDSTTTLHCKVYGFYPRAVDVKWVKNGKDDVISHEAKQILPHPDGTYQIRVTVEVAPKEGDSYSCHVDHSSLEEPLLVLWDPKNDSILLFIIIAVVAVLVVIAAGVGFYVYKKRSAAANSINSPASSTACV
ncbi:class I histocompatibility antigen, F10 alpha chain-like [Ascaphus truei]|uniref:class I histocompatibility antigen, F10 alpha chain-like n=1 Tax=Ascaphus truei TaxID=8439 RepID=UPI003F5A7445